MYTQHTTEQTICYIYVHAILHVVSRINTYKQRGSTRHTETVIN